MAESPPVDCTRCGVCCFSTLETYVRITGEDWAVLWPESERIAHFIGHRAYMKMEAGHCAALLIRPGNNGPEYFCTVYERRPAICRELGRGSPECEAERVLKGDRPHLS